MSNKEEENYLDNLLKNVMEPHPVQPRERGTEDVKELLTEELAEGSTNDSTIEMKLEEMEDLSIDDLVFEENLKTEPESMTEEMTTEEVPETEPEPIIEEMAIEEVPEGEPELTIDELAMEEPVFEEVAVEETHDSLLEELAQSEPELMTEEIFEAESDQMNEKLVTEETFEAESDQMNEELMTEEVFETEPDPIIEEVETAEISELNMDELLMEEPSVEESAMEEPLDFSLEELSEPEPAMEEPLDFSLEELSEPEPVMEETLDFSLDELEETISEPTQTIEQNLDMGDDVLDLDALEKGLGELSTPPEPIAEDMESELMMDSLLEGMEGNDTESELKLDDLDEDILKEIGLDEPLTPLDAAGEEDFDDVLSLLNDDDSDLAEINDLLKKSDSKEPVQDDMMDLLNQMADAEEKQFAQDMQTEKSGETQRPQPIMEDASADAKAGNAKKAKKKKVDANGTEIEKKPGFFAKLFNTLTEEFEPEPTEEELAKEAEEKAAAKQEAMTKKEEEKKAKEEEKKAKAEEKEAAKKAKAEAAEQKKKEKQAAKEAKLAEKLAKEEAEGPKRQKRISPKKIVLVTIFAASVLTGVLLFTNLVSEEGSLQRARKAYYEGNYQTVYVEMYGSELEESDAIVQARSKIILKMQRKYDSYVNHLKMGQEVQALNALIEGLRTYDSINLEAEQYGVMAEVNEIKNNIVNVLNANYGLDEAQARELLQNEDEITYTKSLNHIIMGDKSDLVSNSDMMQKAE